MSFKSTSAWTRDEWPLRTCCWWPPLPKKLENMSKGLVWCCWPPSWAFKPSCKWISLEFKLKEVFSYLSMSVVYFAFLRSVGQLMNIVKSDCRLTVGSERTSYAAQGFIPNCKNITEAELTVGNLHKSILRPFFSVFVWVILFTEPFVCLFDILVRGKFGHWQHWQSVNGKPSSRLNRHSRVL